MSLRPARAYFGVEYHGFLLKLWTHSKFFRDLQMHSPDHYRFLLPRLWQALIKDDLQAGLSTAEADSRVAFQGLFRTPTLSFRFQSFCSFSDWELESVSTQVSWLFWSATRACPEGRGKTAFALWTPGLTACGFFVYRQWAPLHQARGTASLFAQLQHAKLP